LKEDENIEIPVRVGWALIEDVPLILGRLDIFHALAIEFRELGTRILLKLPSE
jgi:hypothetical protein